MSVTRWNSRHWLPSAGVAWCRAVPILHIRAPNKDEKMVAIRKTLDGCSADYPVFYAEEVDVHLNPKISADWQLYGQQKRTITMTQNEKYYLYGTLHTGNGKVSLVGGNSKNSVLFVSLLKNLKATYCHEKNHVYRGQFHDTVTLNHLCHSMWQLLRKVHQFMKTVSLFP